MSDFLPQGYKIPSTANYMKWVKGENKFRILSNAIVGFEYWTKEKKPVRLHDLPEGIPADIGYSKDEDGNLKPNPVRAFWAFLVWNYTDERVQILEITQSTIMTAIQAYVQNKKWGNPSGYDITVTKEGEKMNEVVYTVTVDPHSPLDPQVKEEWDRRKGAIRIEALFDGADPFAPIAQQEHAPQSDGKKVQGLSVEYPDDKINPDDIPF